jgi:hypothetical protein
VRRGALLLAVLLFALPGGPAAARPTYFETLTARFGYSEGDRLYACGVCHYRWEGTGGRNPFGTSVEQQLYTGKGISDAIEAAAAEDADGDGFTSLEELESYETLPGYSCANFFEAIDPPADWHSFITPLVPSCLEPRDIRTAPTAVGLQANVGESASESVVVYNNGKDDPLEISSYALLPGAPEALSVDGPAVPFPLQVGESTVLTLTFAPKEASLFGTALRIASDDPDEPTLDVGVSGVGRVQPLASAKKREACLADVDEQMRRFTKSHTRDWARCQTDEAEGFACDGGARDRKLLRAAAKLHRVIGGDGDRHCEAADITPLLLGQPETCGGGCGSISLRDFGDLADCLVCRQEEETREMLLAAFGAAPPDLPPSVVAGSAAKCAGKIVKALQKGIGRTQKLLGACEHDNVTAEAPVDCEVELAPDLLAIADDVDASLAGCKDTTGLAGCYAGAGDPTCLGDAAVAIGTTLVDVAFGLE